jgi:O-succinylbenzoic acid--CoA ligase
VELRIGAGDGEDEEILVRGPTVARGIRGGELPVDQEGWLHTGDAGRIDDDGHLHVTGRLSGRIVTGGVTVDPAEVEATLAEHPVVRECAVVGLPDEEWGERVAAAVVPSEVAPGDDDRLRQSLAEYCEEALSPGRRPRTWAFLDSLPRNANGKPDRAAIRQILEHSDQDG